MNEFAEETVTMPRRRVWAAILFALFFGPVAQVYCGRLRRALGLYAISWFVSFIAIAFLLYMPFGRLGIVVGLGLFACFYLFIVIDAIRLARRDAQAPLQRYQRWWVYLAMIVASATFSELALELNRRYWSESFVLNGGSMRNTLLPGDRFIVDKAPLNWRTPRRGEIVAYRSPGARDQIFSHRIVALPGDKVEVRDEQFLLNDQLLSEEYALFEGQQPAYEVLNNFAAQTVPAGHVFILGDNRRAAKDSRFEGFVPIDDVVGVARMIFWSREYSMSPPADPRKDRNPRIEWGPIRWSRIGQRLD
jgi:signal peptidase I